MDKRRATKSARSAVEPRQGAQAIRRALAVLRILAAGREDGVPLAEVVRTTGLTRPTVHRIVHVLIEEGIVERHGRSGRYAIGNQVPELALARLRPSRLLVAANPSLQRRICGDQEPRWPQTRQRQLRHLITDRVAAAPAVPLDDAFLDQHVDDAMHGGAGEARGADHLGQWHTVLASCGQDAQHRECAPDRLRALSRFHGAASRFRCASLVHNMDKNATIPSTGQARIWRLRSDRDAMHDVICTRYGI